MIRTLVVDDHALVRDGLCRVLNAEEDIVVVGQTGSGREAVQFCSELKPDVVLLDFNLPDLDGLAVTAEIMAQGSNARVLILTMYANEEYATRSIRAGACGFIVKAAPTSELLAAVRKIANQGVYVTPGVLEKIVERMGPGQQEAPESVLSDREMQVLLKLARGATTREVSTALGLSMSTVETYRGRILDKLNLRNNSDMTRFAIRRGLIDAR